MKKKIKIKKYWFVVSGWVLFIVLINLLAKIPKAADFYTDHIFGLWSETYSRLTGLAKGISVGEMMLIAAIAIIIISLIVLITVIVNHQIKAARTFARRWFKSVLVIGLVVATLMSLNCTALYNCTHLEGNDSGYSAKELKILRNYIVQKCNELSALMVRDENGQVASCRQVGDSIVSISRDEVNDMVKEALGEKLSARYPRLKGYYPDPKPMLGSFFMYETHYIGVYFPFSMEANYSVYLNSLFYPYNCCHELSHLKGYIYEDEANYIAYMACVESGEILLEYSGYINVLNYVCDDYEEAVAPEDRTGDIEVDSPVWYDDFCYYYDEYEELEEIKDKFIIDSQVIEDAGQAFNDSVMEYYDSSANYDEVTLLLLKYYDGILY